MVATQLFQNLSCSFWVQINYSALRRGNRVRKSAKLWLHSEMNKSTSARLVISDVLFLKETRFLNVIIRNAWKSLAKSVRRIGSCILDYPVIKLCSRMNQNCVSGPRKPWHRPLLEDATSATLLFWRKQAITRNLAIFGTKFDLWYWGELCQVCVCVCVCHRYCLVGTIASILLKLFTWGFSR